MTQLSAQQRAGIDKISAWLDDRDRAGSAAVPVFRLFGYAGTGKTTLAQQLPELLGLRRVVYGTYTGKAAHVLRSKGADPVTTIHSAVYMPTTSLEARRALEEARADLDALIERDLETVMENDQALGSRMAEQIQAEMAEIRKRIPELEADARRMSWEWNPMSDWASADLIVLDEVSMVNEPIARDVEAYGVPVLVLGDPAQLPPVEGGGYYTRAQPDHLLTEIHRQALENPITALATRIRNSEGRNLGLERADLTPASMRHAMEHDQVLVWSNRRRWAMVKGIRGALGRPDGEVVAGDRIMCLTNNSDLGVFNGEQFTVLAAEPGDAGPTLTVRTESGLERQVAAFAAGFQGRAEQEAAKKAGDGLKGPRMLATFAQAITVHKAQGSEWNSVYVVNETPGMIDMGERARTGQGYQQARRWLYTAATRARHTLTVTAPRA